jgi:hypothetical protein
VRFQLLGDRRGQQGPQVFLDQLDSQRFRAAQAGEIERRRVFLPAPAIRLISSIRNQGENSRQVVKVAFDCALGNVKTPDD